MKWDDNSKTRVTHMKSGDFYESESSIIMDNADSVS